MVTSMETRTQPRSHAAMLGSGNAAAAGFILVFMTLTMNGLAIWLRYRLRKNIKW